MQLKPRTENKLLWPGLIFILVLVIFTYQQQKITIKADIGQKFQALDLGYSNTPDLFLFLSDFPKIIFHMINGFPDRPEMERIDIDIPVIEYNKILNDRRAAIKANVLTNPTTVKVKIRHKENIYKAKLRLKGDLSDHWKSQYRMSFRISLKAGKSILGFNKFSIHKPSSRQHPLDQTFANFVKNTGNLGSTHNYIHVYVNGIDWGIMNIEEHMSKEFLEKQRRKESLIVRFGNEQKGAIEMSIDDDEKYEPYRLSDPRLYINLYNENKYIVDNINRKRVSYIMQDRVKNEMSSIYDVSSYGKALITATVWNDGHPLKHSNSRHYFNPYTLKLEPILSDAIWPQPIYYRGLFHRKEFDPFVYSFTYKKILETSEFADRLDSTLENVIDASSNVQKTVEQYQNYFPLDPPIDLSNILSSNIQILLNIKDLYYVPELKQDIVIQSINENTGESTLLTYNRPEQDISKQSSLPTESQTRHFSEHLQIRHFVDGRLDIYNLLNDEVTLVNIFLDGKPVLNDPLIIPAYKFSEYKPVSINSNLKGIMDGKLTAKSEYKNNIRSYKLGFSLDDTDLLNPISRQNENLPQFILDNASTGKTIPSGDWTIDSPITIHSDLHIEPGTNIRFAKDAYLIVKGALLINGTKEKPVSLDATNDKWKGLYIINSDKLSTLKNVNIRNTTALEDGLLRLTGAITFYKSDVTMENVTFDNSQAEDALNIVNSNFTLDHINVKNTVSDGIDIDFSDGEILNSKIENIAGDALDYSGSTIINKNIVINNVGDKGLSAGESAMVTIKNIDISNTSIGIASKDGSYVQGENIEITDFQLSAIMTYMKKSFYNYPGVKLENVDFSDSVNVLSRQYGSYMNINGKNVPEMAINVKGLYE
jgi:hypothetical protein